MAVFGEGAVVVEAEAEAGEVRRMELEGKKTKVSEEEEGRREKARRATHPATGPLFFPPPLHTQSSPISLHLPQQDPSPPSLSRHRVFLARHESHARVVREMGARLEVVPKVGAAPLGDGEP